VYRGPSSGPCIGSIYTHPSMVGGIEQLFPSLVSLLGLSASLGSYKRIIKHSNKKNPKSSQSLQREGDEQVLRAIPSSTISIAN
jgi:hypothetical protein